MKMLVRILVGAMGLLSLFLLLNLWFHMEAVTGGLGITVEGLVGRATVRADIGGLFGGIGVFSLMAAWKQSRMWALGALVVISTAILGRLIGVLVDGSGPGVWGPIGVEVVMIGVLLWARQVWRPTL
jgi:hypothetical protein